MGKFPKKDYSSESIRLLALAPSQYGKSYMISKWVIDQFQKKVRGWTWQRVIIFSPTARSDPSQLMMAKEAINDGNPEWLKTNILEYIDEQLMEQIFNANKQIKESDKNPWPYLLIFDDVLCDEALSQRRSSLTKIASIGRHFSISTIISCQIYKGFVQPVVRQQLSMIMVGKINSMESIQLILSEYSMGAGKTAKKALKKMIEFWEEAIQYNDNHGFLVIYPYQQFGSFKRIQIGNPLDGEFIA